MRMNNGRRSPTSYPAIVGVLLLFTVVVAGVASASHHDEATAESPHERVTCPADHGQVGDVDHHRAPRSEGPSDSVQMEVGVGLHPAAVLRLDRFGRIVAAATNTGCPPRQTDDIYILRVRGPAQLITDIDVSRLRWRGDFVDTGRFYTQSRLSWCPTTRRC
jgi:hypothetical protein